MPKLCVLVIGHKAESPGKRNTNSNITEFDFNNDLARRIDQNVTGVRIIRVYRRTYILLPEDINTLNPDFIVSLHCNAFDGTVSGSETLYHHASEKGKLAAEIMQANIVRFLQLRDRGIKPKTSEDRGGYLLKYTNAPCIIVEPFFIDKDDDRRKAQENPDGLAAAYASGIEEIAVNI